MKRTSMSGLAVVCVLVLAGRRAWTDGGAAATEPSNARKGSSLELETHLLSEAGSERATSGAGGKIVTLGQKTHVVWQDSTDKGYFNRVRTRDSRSGQWSGAFTLNKARDNHARPVIAVDHSGYVHVVISGHNSPVMYRRSTRPNDTSEWTEPVKVGKGTYPVLVCDRDNALYLTMRSARRWNGVDLYIKTERETWQKQAKLVKKGDQYDGYAAFQTGMAVGPDGTLHLVSDFYEGKGARRGIHQAVCYMRSRDGGKTWQRSDQRPVTLPARPEDLDVIARDTGARQENTSPQLLLAQGSIVVDSHARPLILYISHLQEPGQLILATPAEGGRWDRRRIKAVETQYPDMRPLSCRGALSISQDDTLYILLELVPLEKGWKDGKPTRKGISAEQQKPVKRLVLLTGKAGAAELSVRSLLEPGTMFNEPNLERPSGANVIPAGRMPYLAYFEGPSRYRKQGELIQNKVQMVQIR